MLRPPVMADYGFIHECYQDWPLSNKGPITVEVVAGWIRRWMARDDEICRVYESGGDLIGVITYRLDPPVIENIVVHPSARGMGNAKRIMRKLQAELVADGYTEFEFEALPGPIADMTVRGRFRRVRDSMGKQTGLPTVIGKVTSETEI